MPVSAGTTNRSNLLSENNNLVVSLVANPDLLKTVLNEIYDYIDANWGDYNTHKTNAVLGHPDGSVTTAKIADGAILTVKLADNSVVAAKIADGVITLQKVDTTSFDTRYYTETEVDTFLSGKTDKTGNHPGTWQGLTPPQIGAGDMNASRITTLEGKMNDAETSLWMGLGV